MLVVACPCALVLATPAAMLASMAWLARHGVLIKGGYALERLAACDTFAFDKTGTLTEGTPRVRQPGSWCPSSDESEVLRLAASAEQASQHPLAAAVVAEAADAVARPRPRFPEVTAAARLQGSRPVSPGPDGAASQVLVGNRRLLAEHGMAIDETVEPLLRALDEQGETPLHRGRRWSDRRRDRASRHGPARGPRRDPRPEAPEDRPARPPDRRPRAGGAAGREEGAHQDRRRPSCCRRTRRGGSRSSRRRAGRWRWSATGSTTPRRWPRPTPASRWGHRGRPRGRGGRPDPAGRSAARPARAGRAVPGHGAGHPPEHHRLRLRAQRRGGASASLGILGPVAAAILHQVGSLLVLLNAMRLLVFGDWAELPPFRQLRAARPRGSSRFDDRLDLEPAWRWCLDHRRWIARRSVGVCWPSFTLPAESRDPAGRGWSGPAVRRLPWRLEPGLHFRLPGSLRAGDPDRAGPRARPGRGLPEGAGESRLRRYAGRRAMGGLRLRPPVKTAIPASDRDGQFLEITASVQYAVDSGNPDSLRRFALGVAGPELLSSRWRKRPSAGSSAAGRCSTSWPAAGARRKRPRPRSSRSG